MGRNPKDPSDWARGPLQGVIKVLNEIGALKRCLLILSCRLSQQFSRNKVALGIGSRSLGEDYAVHAT